MVEKVGIDTGATLTAGQINAAQSDIDSHRDSTETSMIQFGLVDGTQQ